MAENESVWVQPPRCAHIRSKAIYMGLSFHPSGMESGVELPCTCLKTMQLFGPDDEPASLEACNASRACFEAEGA